MLGSKRAGIVIQVGNFLNILPTLWTACLAVWMEFTFAFSPVLGGALLVTEDGLWKGVCYWAVTYSPRVTRSLQCHNYAITPPLC